MTMTMKIIQDKLLFPRSDNNNNDIDDDDDDEDCSRQAFITSDRQSKLLLESWMKLCPA